MDSYILLCIRLEVHVQGYERTCRRTLEDSFAITCSMKACDSVACMDAKLQQ